MNRIFYIFLILSIYCTPGFSARSGPAVNGTLNLSNWDFEKDGIAYLDGEWEFYWNQLLTPQDIQNETIKPSGMFTVPGKWKNYELNGNKLDGSGYATFRLKVTLPHGTKNTSLHVTEIMSACKIWINGKLFLEVGRTGTSLETSFPEKYTYYNYIETDTNVIDLIVQVSNYHHRSGGFFKHIRIGSKDDIERYVITSYSLDMLMFGALLIIAIYFLIQFFLRRKDKYTLYFGLIILLIALRSIASGDAFLFFAFRHLDYILYYRIEYITYYFTIPLFALYLHSLFPDEFTRKHTAVYLFIGFVFSILILFLSTAAMGNTLLFYQIFSMAAALHFSYLIIRAFFHKRKGASLFFIGIVMLSIFMLNDILFTQNVINTFMMFPVGMFFFIIIQLTILAQRFTGGIHTNEKLTEELLQINLNLEKDVKERTKEIEQQNKELKEQSDILQMVNDEIASINTELIQQKKEIEDKNENITASIRYAKLTQTAFLTPGEEIRKMFRDHFILFQPRDIVSGDFYWFKKLQPAGDDVYVFAIGDSTGHGISAAFLSTFGIAFMNEVFSSSSMVCDFNASQIMTDMRNRIHELLSRSVSDKLHDEGIDIMLGIYHPQSRTLLFSGTNCILYYVPADTTGDEDSILEYKHVSHTLGAFTQDPLADNMLNIKPGDMIYLATDGYANQLGGPLGKKFMSKNVKSMIAAYHRDPMSKQKEIMESTLHQWMQPDQEQTDDILIIGLKF